MCKISIIIPVYNVEKYLNKCIESILSQTYENFEVILINDGSTDKSAKICDIYKQKDNRIIVINKDNTGASDCRNIGIEVARGKYINFIDSDDWIEKNMLLEMVELSEKHNSDITISGIKFDRIAANGKVINTQINSHNFSVWDNLNKIRKNIISLFPNALINSSCNKLYKKEVLIRNNIRFIKTNIGEDTSFNIDVVKNASSIVVSDKSYYHYMRYENIKTLTNGLYENAFDRYLEIHNQIENIFKEWNVLDETVISEINRTMYSQYFATILKILNANDKKYSYKYKKALLDKGLKNAKIVNSFYYYDNSSFKEAIFRLIIKKRMYLIANILNNLINKKKIT